MAKNLIKVAVYIKASQPTVAEKEFIDKLGVAQVLNAQRFRPISGERVDAQKVYNLTDNKEIDEFYKDVIINPFEPQEPVVFKPEKEKEEVVGENSEKKAEAEAETEKPTKAKATTRPTRKTTTRKSVE